MNIQVQLVDYCKEFSSGRNFTEPLRLVFSDKCSPLKILTQISSLEMTESISWNIVPEDGTTDERCSNVNFLRQTQNDYYQICCLVDGIYLLTCETRSGKQQ